MALNGRARSARTSVGSGRNWGQVLAIKVVSVLTSTVTIQEFAAENIVKDPIAAAWNEV
jgi:hypothetical protein